MQEALLNLILFHSTHLIIPKSLSNLTRFILTMTVLSLFNSAQLYQYHSTRPQNYFELIQAPSLRVSPESIEDIYQKLNKKPKPQVYECLMHKSCKDQYIKFGGYIESDKTTEQLVGEGQAEFRLTYPIGFYFVFCFLASSLAGERQKSGLRFAVPLAVVFCINEVSMMAGRQEQSEGGQLDVFFDMFSPLLCIFEKIYHIIYLFIFNFYCSYAIIFSQNEAERKHEALNTLFVNHDKIKFLLQSQAKQIKGLDIDCVDLRKQVEPYVDKDKKVKEGQFKQYIMGVIKAKDLNEFEKIQAQNQVQPELPQQPQQGQTKKQKLTLLLFGMFIVYKVYKVFVPSE